MDISLKWLSQYIDISAYEPTDLAEKITIAGVEVERIKYLAQGSKLVIGEVISCEKHPDSDHLHACQVDIGSEILQIVCGAANVKAKQKVIVSKVGAYLPAVNLTIKKGNIRGVESNGMICSLLELGVDKKFLNEEQIAGIEELDPLAPVGNEDPLGYLGLDDVIFELKPTPNRGDVLSLLSFAYEVGAILGLKVKDKIEVKLPKLAKSSYTVGQGSPKCPSFAIKGVSGVVIKESPKWLQNILRSSGLRSINNVVDIGNYVMLLLGQPLHMYDAKKLASRHFVVKDNLAGDFLALDEQKYKLEVGDLIVTNADRFSCLAGVMGAYETMIDENTTDLAIEAALFDGISVRRTSQRLQLNSDSSTYFIRGVDETRALLALDLAASLLVEYAEAKLVEETSSYAAVAVTKEAIKLSVEKVNKVLGTSFTASEIASVFKRLNFAYKLEASVFSVVPPNYRKDIQIAEDLIEEIIRLLGFEHLKSTYPVTENVGYLSMEQKKRRLIRDYLLAQGLDEALSYSLISPKYSEDFAVLSASKGESVKLLHPLTEEHSIMRKTLVPSLLLASNYNHYHKEDDLAIFELSKVYNSKEEVEHLAILLSGNITSLSWLSSKQESVNYYHLKGLVSGLLKKLGIEPSRYQLVRVSKDDPYYHFGRAALIKTGSKVWGVLGEVHPRMLKKYDVLKTVVCELDLSYLYQLKSSPVRFVSPSLYPAVVRDIALVVAKKVEAQQLIKIVKKAGKSLVNACQVLDVYEGKLMADSDKSIALRITYLDQNKTLTDSEVNALHEEVLKALEKEAQAVLRS
ncbi:phenylalanine--tRNA ligase subunit beta [bacterium]|nr:phenylalanine--tRNA ligase subunit beta [bacterium]